MHQTLFEGNQKCQQARLALFDFEQASGKSVPDTTGNGNDLTLYGNTKVQQDPQRGNVLFFGGTADDYAALTPGFLDQCREYTVCMDAKSDSDGNFFTFAAGQDEYRYAFFKIAQDHFRFQTTVDTWKGETGMRYDLDGTQWHRYVFAVTPTTCRLYVDGRLAAETDTLNTNLSDMGDNTKLLFGKSFYGDDVGYAGYLDNLTVYPYALSEEEITGSVTAKLKGDVNADGAVSIADAVAMVKYLAGNGTLADWQAGDLNDDGWINAVDLTLLKRILLK